MPHPTSLNHVPKDNILLDVKAEAPIQEFNIKLDLQNQ